MTENKTLNFGKMLDFCFGARRLAEARKYGRSQKDLEEFNIGFSQSVRDGMAVFVRIFSAGGYHLLSGGNMAYPLKVLDEKLETITKSYKKSGRKDGINKFFRKNGHIFGKLV